MSSEGKVVLAAEAKSLTTAFPVATPWRMPPETTAFEEELLELLQTDLGERSSQSRQNCVGPARLLPITSTAEQPLGPASQH